MLSNRVYDRHLLGSTPTAAKLVVAAVVLSVDITSVRTPDNPRARIAATKSKLDLFQSKRDAYWLERVGVDGQTNRLWRTLSDVLGRSN